MRKITARHAGNSARLLILTAAFATSASAQTPAPNAAPRGPRSPGDTLHSPILGESGRVTFQLYAPKATDVNLRSEGPAPFANQKMTKSDAGVWTLTASVPPDLYIYWYDVDGVPVADPRNNRTRVNTSTVRSLVEVPGAASAFFAERDVPHGQVSTVWYQSAVLGQPRRMQIYTPPGYATSGERYPVLYLLHGAGDDDQSWLMAGRANFILDNLIASGKAKPMIVVMPNGSVQRAPGTADPYPASFKAEIMPYVEKNFRLQPGRENRAIAGLSMGGGHTLAIGLPNLDSFSHLGVFSSGFLGQGGADSAAVRYRDVLGDPNFNSRVKLLWLSTGKEDFILPQTKATLAVFDRSGIKYTYKESEGGHIWPNWRAYLTEFAPQLFR